MDDFDLYDVLAELGYGLEPKTRLARAEAFDYKAAAWLAVTARGDRGDAPGAGPPVRARGHRGAGEPGRALDAGRDARRAGWRR